MLCEPGDCVLSKHDRDGFTDLYIDHADPHVWISDQLLRSVHGDDDNAWMSLNKHATLVRDPHCDIANCCAQQDHGTCFMGAILTIKARNRTVVYKIGRWIGSPGVGDHGVWEASWPD